VIVVRLMGGLGNQLFQYAAGRRLATRHGVDLVLDLGWFVHEAHLVAAPRTYELGFLELPHRQVELDPSLIARWEQRRRRFPRRSLNVIRQRDGDMSVDPRVLSAPDESLLIGYWQSERYFAEIEGTIRAEIGLADGDDGDLVAVHIRRGDYVSHPETNAFHGVLGREYYDRAFAAVASRIPSPRYLAFSDEPAWVEAEFVDVGSLEVVAGGAAGDDLRRMASCRHHVIANSSFSWWGAWLGELPGSVVVAPARWFEAPCLDSADIVPDRWLRV
jgi:hypothetical protein